MDAMGMEHWGPPQGHRLGAGDCPEEMGMTGMGHWGPPRGDGDNGDNGAGVSGPTGRVLRRGAAGEAVSVPSFGGAGAFVSYPPLTNVHHELRVEAEFLPRAPDGLLLFSAGKAAPVEDFVALAMVGGHLEFRYELGSGRLARPDGVSPGGSWALLGWPGITLVPRCCHGLLGIAGVLLVSLGSLGAATVPGASPRSPNVTREP